LYGSKVQLTPPADKSKPLDAGGLTRIQQLLALSCSTVTPSTAPYSLLSVPYLRPNPKGRKPHPKPSPSS
jgi:hypothetical protein